MATSTRWKAALAAATGAGVAAVAVIALSGRASEPGTAAPVDSTPTTEPGDDTGGTPSTDGRTITVTGHGTVSVVPDTATLSAGVQATAETATAALDQVAQGSQDLLGTFTGLGIADEDVQTSGLSLWPTYANDGQRITGYQASTNVTVTVREVSQVGTVVDALKGLGENLTLSGISFSYDDPEQRLQEARTNAIANARVRAEQYAAAAGTEVGDVMNIIEGTVSDPIVFREMAADAAAPAAEMAVAPGSQELAADVTVVFEMS
jgi:uncharacterized protein YggE